MKKSFTLKHNVRKSFGKIPDLVDMPNLLEIQKNSYDLFLQKNVKPEDREDIGLQAVFKKVFPITDFSGIAELRFVKYELEEPRYDVDECIQRDLFRHCGVNLSVYLVNSHNNIYIISDEIYEHISYNKKVFSFASIPEMYDRTITVNGVAKALSFVRIYASARVRTAIA